MWEKLSLLIVNTMKKKYNVVKKGTQIIEINEVFYLDYL